MPDLEKLLNAIDAAEQTSYGSDNDSDLQSDRSKAIQFYRGDNLDPAPAGRSQVVDRSVFETIQWILPSLCRIFANGDDIVELVPFGPEDEDQAKQESDYLNYLVTQKNRWFDTCLTWFQDALETKNAYCLAYMDKAVQVEKETYRGQSQEAIALLTQDSGVEVVEFSEYPDEDGQPVPMLDPYGQPVIDDMGNPVLQQPMLYDIVIKRTKPKNKVCFQVLPPERCKTSQRATSHTLDGTDYFEFWEMKTISELRAEGFDVPDDVAADEDTDNEEDDARDHYGDQLSRFDDNPIDPAMRLVKARMVWIRHDYDEDGIAELQRCLVVGKRILYREEETRIPVACIVPYPNPHRHIGMSVSDIVVDIQRIKTAILRGGLDNLYLSNNPRTVINDQINLDDMLVSRPGGVVRSEGDGPVQENYSIIATPNVFPQAMEGLEYMDRIKESRTGVNRQFSGIENDRLLEPKSATEASQLSTMAAQRVEQIARIFASGVEYLFAVAHEIVLKHGHQAEVVKLRGKWVTVDPSQWRTGRDMRIVVGYGAGNKDALAGRLMTILNLQKEALQGGLRIANEQTVYEAAVEFTKASDFTAPQRFWVDPSTLGPPQPQPDPNMEMVRVEDSKVKSNEQIKAAELARDEQESIRKDALERYKADLKAQVDIYLKQIEKGGSIDLEKVRADLKAAPVRMETDKLDATQKELASKLAEVMQSQKVLQEVSQRLVEAAATMSGPREVVRDKNGRVTGIKFNGTERKVQRDSDGRVTGIQ